MTDQTRPTDRTPTIDPDPSAEAEERIADGMPRTGRDRRWWIIGGIGVLLMSALAVWFGVSATTGRVHWVYTGHDIVSDRQVDVRFDLRRDPSRAVSCELEAQDGGHTVIGRSTVQVPPAPESPSRHIMPVQTATRAVTGYVTQCWYSDEAPRHS